MLTTSEIAVTLTIWALTALGGFFGIRAALRRRRLKCECVENQAGGSIDQRNPEIH